MITKYNYKSKAKLYHKKCKSTGDNKTLMQHQEEFAKLLKFENWKELKDYLELKEKIIY